MCHDIAKILASVFIAMAEKENHQVIALWSKDFEKLDIKIDGYIPVLISDLFAITSEDYNKFFNKIQTKSYTKKELKQMIFSKYHNYIDFYNSNVANKLPPYRNIDHQI